MTDQPRGLQTDLLKCSRETRQYVLGLGAEIEQLRAQLERRTARPQADIVDQFMGLTLAGFRTVVEERDELLIQKQVLLDAIDSWKAMNTAGRKERDDARAENATLRKQNSDMAVRLTQYEPGPGLTDFLDKARRERDVALAERDEMEKRWLDEQKARLAESELLEVYNAVKSRAEIEGLLGEVRRLVGCDIREAVMQKERDEARKAVRIMLADKYLLTGEQMTLDELYAKYHWLKETDPTDDSDLLHYHNKPIKKDIDDESL